ncbi:MAG TPA: YkgJ family cysteine cluster protein [Verrucomicrobiae bacterium]|nr:YkgJ family cysteine cluster protein [Verrucomicrobiae bacterium]
MTDILCLQCGLCCNGVLFADVRRERGEDSRLFREHSLRVAQPCPAFNASDCKCALYAERPNRCRTFECKQLLAVRAGKKTSAVALKRIREAWKLVTKVEGLLDKLAFNDTSLPLSKRFQGCQRAAERGKISPEHFDRLADLQLAMHQLNALLAQDFYA